MEYFNNKIEKESKDRPKVQFLLEVEPELKPGQMSKCQNKLTRNQASFVFQTRTTMIKVKGNYKKDNGTSYAE